MMLLPGSLFTERYRIIRPIGSGGFGAVYEAEHLVTERRVALKTLWPHLAGEPSARSRFLRECRLAAQVDSDYIVGVLDAGVDEGSNAPFLVMELLEGENLNARLRRKRVFSTEECVTYLGQVAAALELTHAAGIVHCDLKPANLFLSTRLDGSPQVKVLDFGIAKALGTAGMEASLLLGTPLYMAPEQITTGSVSTLADVYALAQIAFRFLAGQTYYRVEQRSSEGGLLLALTIAEGLPEPASVRAERYGVTLNPRFDPWFACAAHVLPEERFGSAKQAVLALAWSLGIPPPAPLSEPKRRMVGALTMAGDGKQEPSTAAAPPAPLEPTLHVPTQPSLRVVQASQRIRRFVAYGVGAAFLWCGVVSSATYAWLRAHAEEVPDVVGIPAGQSPAELNVQRPLVPRSSASAKVSDVPPPRPR